MTDAFCGGLNVQLDFLLSLAVVLEEDDGR